MLRQSFSSDELKCAEATPVYKKKIKRIRITTDLSVFCLMYQNYVRGVCINKSMNILNHFCQKIKVGSEFSDFLNILFGVPQGSILGPILYIISIADFFINNDTNFASYADDTTPYVCGQNVLKL